MYKVGGTTNILLGENTVYPKVSKNEACKVLRICERIASPSKIVGACRYYGAGEGGILLVVEGYPQKMKFQSETIDSSTVKILVVDQWIFERDVENGWLGEFLSEKITFFYEPIVNEEYLEEQSLKVRTRIMKELLENLVIEYPELSTEFLIKPEYFIYETILRRVRLFPLIIQNYLAILRSDNEEGRMESVKKGFVAAARELARGELIRLVNGSIKIEDKFKEGISTRTSLVSSLLKTIRRTLLRYIVGVHPEIANLVLRDQVIILQKAGPLFYTNALLSKLEDPEDYIFLPTSLGYTPLSDKTTIDAFLNRRVLGSSASDITIERLGGVLNSVYLVKYRDRGVDKKVVVKRFDDWTGFKWFPLAIWALGTKTFIVSGKRRMEKEYSMNTFLYKNGFPVPRILHVSPKERLVFEEYIEGENLVDIIKGVTDNRRSLNSKENPIMKTAKRIAEAHTLDVAIGDCKPENVIVSGSGETYFVDLEQGTKNGDFAWDVAEFLYFLGHYVSIFSDGKIIDLMIEEFIKGYLSGGGELDTLRKAASIKYSKVFSLFTPPRILLRISDHLERAPSF